MCCQSGLKRLLLGSLEVHFKLRTSSQHTAAESPQCLQPSPPQSPLAGHCFYTNLLLHTPMPRPHTTSQTALSLKHTSFTPSKCLIALPTLSSQ